MAPAPVLLKPKKKCCKDKPRCKKCPVVLKKLEKQGLAAKQPCGRVLVEASKKELKAARARG